MDIIFPGFSALMPKENLHHADRKYKLYLYIRSEKSGRDIKINKNIKIGVNEI